ncbi:hypothetical protein AB1Y20_020657 [Prymnesium parvum]|uniref:Uncharacterized protein n=1 Tax=Prymnesium parvum TaxID=97485 RepID=A0AB34JY02_PRYPA
MLLLLLAAPALLLPPHPSRAARAVACASAGPTPEEWREFRAKLIAGGGLSGLQTTANADGGAPVPPEGEAAPPPQADDVAPANLELLKAQNEDLWNEYLLGGWAHESPLEAGGLLVRAPLPSQLAFQMRHAPSSHWGAKLRARLAAAVPSDSSAAETQRILSQWQANHRYCYRAAEAMVEEVMAAVAARASNGRVAAADLSEGERQMVTLFAAAQEEWQQVCLVVSASGEGNVCVAINRPLAKAVSERLAALILNGGAPPPHSADVVSKFVRAFGEQAGVYVGGPTAQAAPALLVHGHDLPGSTELAPGSRLFTGGVAAAIDGVLAGEYSPLDFRWFIGRHENLPTSGGAWRAVACARPVALKQCLGLPKPLWHEVLELCGGELAELSRMELLKRDDLQL